MAVFYIDEFFINGLLQLAGLFLSIIAGIFAFSMFKISHQIKKLWCWKVLIIGLAFFAIHKVFSALHAFGIFRTTYLGQLLPFAILSFTLWSVIFQIQTVKVEAAKRSRK